MLNSATVVRLPERTPIAVDSIDIAETADDMFMAFALSIANPADLALLIPGTSPREVEINVNGHVWTAIIESWGTTRVFPGRTVQVAGRSRTALLDAPYAPQRAYAETSERLAVQLVDQELSYTDFSADYGTLDWTVPAGAWHYDAQSPAGAIRTIAAASGAVARSHPWDKIIEILPRYPASPWDWDTTAPDKTILDDYTPRIVEKDATSGAAGYEIDIPLWPDTATDKPGLVRPLDLVAFAAAVGWKALATSTRISVRSEQGGNASVLTVTQTLGFEAPPAAPRYDYVLVSGAQVGVSDPIIRAGSAGTSRLPQIVDPLITAHAVAAERGRNAIAGGGDGRAASNLWASLIGLIPQSRLTKGNVTALNSDGSYTIATSDGATIRARPLPGQVWTITDGVYVQDGRIIDSAPALDGITQYV